MEFVNPDVASEHARWVERLSEESSQFSNSVISIVDVLDAHFSIVDYFLEEGTGDKAVGGIGPREEGLLSSAVA
ncbi:MAG: hypothetical protein AB7W37_17045, partial [Syntrophobacteraceae bacterium]